MIKPGDFSIRVLNQFYYDYDVLLSGMILQEAESFCLIITSKWKIVKQTISDVPSGKLT